MKKFLRIAGISAALLILTAALAACFIKPDRYRPFLEKRLSESIGRPVRLGKIHLDWGAGIAVRVDGATIFADDAATRAAVEARALRAAIDLGPLLTRKVVARTVEILDLKATVVRETDGTIGVEGMPRRLAAPKGESTAAAAFLGNVSIQHAVIRFVDRAGGPVSPLEIGLDAGIRNVSLRGPIDVTAEARVFSKRQNLKIETKFYLPDGDRPARAESLRIDADLSNVDAAALVESIPAVREAGISSVGGRVSVRAGVWTFGPVTPEAARIELVGVRAMTSRYGELGPLTALGETRGDVIEIENAGGPWAAGTVSAKGRFSGKGGALSFQVSDAKAEKISRPRFSEPYLRADVFVNGRAEFLFADVARSLHGQAVVSLRDATFVNLNPMRMVYDKVSSLPGAGEKLLSSLPSGYDRRLNERDTPVAPFDVRVTIGGGVARLDRTAVQGGDFALSLSAAADLVTGVLGGDGVLVVSPMISAAFARSSQDVQILFDSAGQIQIPLRVRGSLSQPSVLPDLDLIGSRLAAAKGQELLSALLTKKKSPDGAQDAPGGKSSVARRLLKSLF